MRRPVGIETEYGLNCEGFSATSPGAPTGPTDGPPGVDFGYECASIVRAVAFPGGFRGWDYRGEDPYQDLRGMRADRLARDPNDLDGPDDRSRKLTRDELLANTVLLNGARYYNDHNHPEYCTEATPDLFELVAQDRAGELIVHASETARNETLAREIGSSTRVRLLKNNTDYHGRSYGMHENYLCARSTALEALVRGMTPHLVTRQLYAGAGKVGVETSGATIAPGFQMSQRADFFEERIGINTTAKRPIFNTRDEPHANSSRYRRLHCIAGDANRSEWATAMKVGTTALVLDLIEDGWKPEFEIADPVKAIKAISRDTTMNVTVPMVDGRTMTALAIQHLILDACSATYAGRDPETDWVLSQWTEALDALGTDLERLATRVDWIIKRSLFIKIGTTGDPRSWGDARLRRLDMAYHMIDPRVSLFEILRKQGRVTDLVDQGRLDWCAQTPPPGTRGAIRGALLARFGSQIRKIEWDSVTFEVGSKEWRLDLEDITGPVIDRVIKLVDRSHDLSSLVAAMKGGSRDA